MNPSLTDRVVSILAYLTFGIFSIIWLVFANLIRKPISGFLGFNLYQAIFISVILAAISLVYSIAINLLSVIPFLNNLVKWFDLFFNQTPIYFSFTLSSLLILMLILYLTIISLLGKRPYLPMISEAIGSSFGGF